LTQDEAFRAQPRDRRVTGRRVEVSRPLWAAGIAGGLATLLVSVLPSLSFAYRSEPAHAAIESAAFLVAGLAATLVGGRAVRSGARSDLLLAASLGTLALTNLVFSLIPTLAGGANEFASWGGLAGRLVGASLFALAALAPERRLPDAARSLVRTGALVVAGLAVLAVAVGLLADGLPVVIDPRLSPEDASRPRLVGNEVALAAQAVMLLLYVAAAFGFAQQARQRADRLLTGFAAAAVLSAFARLNYLLFPSLYSQWVYTGDVLRFASYLLILGVVAVELLDYQRRASVTAVLDERRRVARELHDGLAQELVFLRTEASRLRGAEGAEGLVPAADRAIEEARAAIATLNRPLDEPLGESLRQSAQAVAGRAAVSVVLEDDGPDEVAPEVRFALSRLVREATGNAIKHGGAAKVTIRLDGVDGLRVDVRDDGAGFDTTAPVREDAYGLLSMRERAEALGGRFDIVSQPGSGTTVSVRLP
jgi:signal transduction histidine kinase